MRSIFLNHSYFNLFGNFHYEYKVSILIPPCEFFTVSHQIRHAACGFGVACVRVLVSALLAAPCGVALARRGPAKEKFE